MASPQSRDIWRTLTTPGGIVHRLLPADAIDATHLAVVHAAVEGLEPEIEIEVADRAVRIIHPKPLAGAARETMIDHVLQAATLGRRRIELNDVRPAAGEHVERSMTDAQHEIAASMPAALDELARLEAHDDAPIRAAARVLREAVEGVRALVSADGPAAATEASPVELLGADLLLTDLPLGEGLEPEASADEVRAALAALLRDPVDWSAAYRRHAARGDAMAAGRILSRLERTARGEAGALREASRAELDAQRTELARALDEAQRAVEQGAAQGSLGEAERAEIDAKLVAVELAGDAVARGGRAHADLATVLETLAARRGEGGAAAESAAVDVFDETSRRGRRAGALSRGRSRRRPASARALVAARPFAGVDAGARRPSRSGRPARCSRAGTK